MTEHIARKILPNEVILSAYFDKNEIEKITLEKNIFSKNKKEINKFSYTALITGKNDIVTFSTKFENQDILLGMHDGISLKDIWNKPLSYHFVQDFLSDFKRGTFEKPINLTSYSILLNKYINNVLKMYSLLKEVSQEEYNKDIIKQRRSLNKIINDIIKSR